MKGLLLKDFRILAQQKKLALIYVVVAVMISFTMDASFLVSYFPMIGMLLVLSTISYDNYDNGMAFLMTLPAARKTYATEKYVISMIGIVSTWTVSIGLQFFSLIFLKKEEFNPVVLIAQDLIMLPIFALIISLMIPIELKYGSEKGRLVIFAVFAVIMVITIGGKSVASFLSSHTGFDPSSIIAALSSVNPVLIFCVGMAIAAALFILSLSISRSIMEKKEF